MRTSILLFALLAACYSPDYGAASCAVRCGAGELCPDGFTCRGDGFCHRDADGPLCGPCEPRSCGEACGELDDGCGATLSCGECPSPLECGIAEANRCDDPGGECTPACEEGSLACGDDGCGGSCGDCPDERWDCHEIGLCCIRSGERCAPFTEGCNCCPGLFCISGFCQPAAGCELTAEPTPSP